MRKVPKAVTGTAVVMQFGQRGRRQLAVLEPGEDFLLDVGFLQRANDAYIMHDDSVERNGVWREVDQRGELGCTCNSTA